MGHRKTTTSVIGKVFLGIWFALLCSYPCSSRAAEVAASAVNNASMSVYDDATLLIQIDSDRGFIDHEKQGFFRLGLMPILVVEGVKIQILSGNCLTNLTLSLDSLSFPHGNIRKLELRQIEVALLNEKEPRLKAASARLNRAGGIELSNVLVAMPEAGQISLPKATLQITGLAAGSLRWRQEGIEKELTIFNPQLLKKS